MIMLSLIVGYYDIGLRHADHKSKVSVLQEFKEFRSLGVQGKKLLIETSLSHLGIVTK